MGVGGSEVRGQRAADAGEEVGQPQAQGALLLLHHATKDQQGKGIRAQVLPVGVAEDGGAKLRMGRGGEGGREGGGVGAAARQTVGVRRASGGGLFVRNSRAPPTPLQRPPATTVAPSG